MGKLLDEAKKIVISPTFSKRKYNEEEFELSIGYIKNEITINQLMKILRRIDSNTHSGVESSERFVSNCIKQFIAKDLVEIKLKEKQEVTNDKGTYVSIEEYEKMNGI